MHCLCSVHAFQWLMWFMCALKFPRNGFACSMNERTSVRFRSIIKLMQNARGFDSHKTQRHRDLTTQTIAKSDNIHSFVWIYLEQAPQNQLPLFISRALISRCLHCKLIIFRKEPNQLGQIGTMCNGSTYKRDPNTCIILNTVSCVHFERRSHHSSFLTNTPNIGLCVQFWTCLWHAVSML